MNIIKIENELINCFGIRLDVREVKLPDRIEIISRPVDFEKSKGFMVCSTIKWISLTTQLKFDNFSGDLLKSIMLHHKDKVKVFRDTVCSITENGISKNIIAKTSENMINSDIDEINLTTLSLYMDSPTIDIGICSIEEYVIGHQIQILALVLLLFDLEENYSEYQEMLPAVAEGESEGARIRIEINKYERSRVNRQACLNFHGYSCKICGFNFKKHYGDIGKNFIHVHHIKPVSEIDVGYLVNPITDLIPVCPNCHSIIHLTIPPRSISEMKKIINEGRNVNTH
jgi:5-methylcytosine-specific restriction enzyme A